MIVWLLRRDLRAQKAMLDRWIRPEVASGLLPPHAFAELARPTRVVTFLQALAQGGHRLHRLRLLQHASWSLAAHRADCDRRARQGTPVTAADRAVDDALRLLVARQVRLLEAPAAPPADPTA